MRIQIRSFALFPLVSISVLAGMIVFGTKAAPPPLTSISAPFLHVDFSDLPPIRTTPARDGAPLAYRVWPASGGEPERVVVAIHGSSAHSTSLHPLAKALARPASLSMRPTSVAMAAAGGTGTSTIRASLTTTCPFS